MEYRDALHGTLFLQSHELPIVQSRHFQRLRQIKQMGFGENSFPSAHHNRFIHSLGAMEVATQAFASVFGNSGRHPSGPLLAETQIRFKNLIRLGALLHDLGHGPLSHATEFAMPMLHELKIPISSLNPKKPRQATHEDYTLKMILDSSLTPLLERAAAGFGFKPIHIAALIDSRLRISEDEGAFFQIEKIDYRPILSQLISSELDADRMDYLRRDSLHCGVSYGQFDYPWLVSNLTFHITKNKCYLALQHRALYTFEDFLLSRFHMFLMVYFHHKCIIYDEMLAQYLSRPDCDYRLPADIEKYCETDDTHLTTHLTRSSNEWARRIVEKNPYSMLIELQSGIPATRSAQLEQQDLFMRLQEEMRTREIPFLLTTSSSELSKYFRRPGDPIYICYDNHYSPPSFIPLEECTDLFQKYQEKRSISRLYVHPDSLAQVPQLRVPT